MHDGSGARRPTGTPSLFITKVMMMCEMYFISFYLADAGVVGHACALTQ